MISRNFFILPKKASYYDITKIRFLVFSSISNTTSNLNYFTVNDTRKYMEWKKMEEILFLENLMKYIICHFFISFFSNNFFISSNIYFLT